jgi:hypothetical protein
MQRFAHLREALTGRSPRTPPPGAASPDAADGGADCASVVPWREVRAFLDMAAMALDAKEGRAAAALREVEHANADAAARSAAAREESSFLALQLQALLVEKEALQARVQALERDRLSLEEQLGLMRAQAEDAAAAGGARRALATERARRERAEAAIAQIRALFLLAEEEEEGEPLEEEDEAASAGTQPAAPCAAAPASPCGPLGSSSNNFSFPRAEASEASSDVTPLGSPKR